MSELDDWNDNELLSFYELVGAVRDAKYADDSLLGKIQHLDTLRLIIKQFSFIKMDDLLKALARVVNKRSERQENT